MCFRNAWKICTYEKYSLKPHTLFLPNTYKRKMAKMPISHFTSIPAFQKPRAQPHKKRALEDSNPRPFGP